MIAENLLKSIDRGKKGLNVGLETGLPKIDSITYGVQHGWFTVIGGDSGSGKSSLALYTAVFEPFMNYYKKKDTKVDWLLFSFEMSSEVLFAKLLSIYIYEEFGRVVSYSDILSFNGRISEEDYNLVLLSKPWLEEFENHCTIIDKPVEAKALYAICKEWSKKFGTYEQIDEHREVYNRKNESQYLIVLVDHIKLLSTSQGSTSKQEIDKACDFLIYFRNKCKFSIYVVQQLNRNFKSMDRRMQGFELIQLDDFSDSSGPVQSAETVISIFHPFREKLSKCEGYDIKQLRDRFRLISILKNRFGLADKNVGLCFYGENGKWMELPHYSEINDYEIYKNLK